MFWEEYSTIFLVFYNVNYAQIHIGNNTDLSFFVFFSGYMLTMIMRNNIIQPLTCSMDPSIYGHCTHFILELHGFCNKLSLKINVK